ncbi:MAG: hypothetical protein LBV04_02275 [Deferribacteraceae bacterium]|jgi:light-regulated signal transduction histidine kinase (bacteriophytochrome)|nr:hypothetical protein [Deferribacteraceae bacterium]
MRDDLKQIYNYFSHHMRNCTAMIATSVTLLSYKMGIDEDQLFKDVIESSFLLDLFDRGMHTCFQDVFGDSTDYSDELSLKLAVCNFVEQCDSYVKEKGIKLNLNIEDAAIIRGKVHEIRVLTNTIIYEMLHDAQDSFNISVKRNKIIVEVSKDKQEPAIWSIFKRIFQKYGVQLSFDGKICSLEYKI